MQQAIEAPIALEHGSGDLVVVGGHGLLEIQQRDDRFRGSRGFDLPVHRFELARVAADEDYVRAVAGARERDCAPDSITGTRDRDDTAGELAGARHIGCRIEGSAQVPNPFALRRAASFR